MYCPKCGTQNTENAVFCQNCGKSLSTAAPASAPWTNQAEAPPTQAFAPVVQAQRTSGMAIAALVLGIIGFSLFAIIFGAIAINQTGKDPNLKGRGMAVAGLVLGIIWFFISILLVVFAVIIATNVSY